MTGLTSLLLYFPICLMIFSVLEACRTDEVKRVILRSLINCGVLTLVMVVGSIVVFFINKHL